MAKQTFTTGQVLTAAQVNALQTNDFNQTVSAKTASYILVAADKGTRIEFNTSGSVTCTVNNGLFDAGDTVFIQNTGVGVVTITAGTATVNTSATLTVNQYEGGVLYFVSASAAIWFEYASAATGDITGITTGATSGLTGGVTSGTADLKLNTAAKGDLLVGTGAGTVSALTVGTNNQYILADSTQSTGLRYGSSPQSLLTATGDLLYASAANTPARLGIGSSNQVLTVSGGVPTWATASSGGYTQLATGTFSGTVVTLSSISSSYQNLVLVISGATWGTGVNDIGIRFNNDATSIYKEYVTGARGTSSSAQVAETWNASGENIGRVQLGSAWNNTNGKNHHILTFKDYTTAKYPIIEWQGVYENAAGFVSLGLGTWTYDSSSVINRIDIQTSATYTFSGGTYTLYGVK